MPDGASPVLRESGRGVATVTLSAPRRNSLTDEVLRELVHALEAADAEPGVRCLVLCGTDDVFASGADIRALLAQTTEQAYDGPRAALWRRVRGLRTPLVAGVSGLCLGAGLELALLADIVIASETARFGLPETQLGLIPGAGGTQLLPRAIGKAKAMEVVLAGRLLDADEAERCGLVSRVVPAAEWRAQALAVAASVAQRPATATRLAKEAVAAAFETPLQTGIALERRSFALAFGTADAHEGLTAFLEKREPRFSHD